MRVSATFGLVVLVASLASCVQRNYDRCLTTGTDYPCESGKFCQAIPGDPNNVGICVDSECTVTATGTPNGCTTATKPVCTTQGSCAACANNAQCAAVSTTLPICTSDGSCGQCSTYADCMAANPLTLTPACDATTHTCRACTLHADCPADSVCVKDKTLTTLAEPLMQGMCTSRVVVVSDGSTLPAQVSMATAQKPYVLVKNSNVAGMVRISPISGLPQQHLISASADFSPLQLSVAAGKPAPAIVNQYNKNIPTFLVNSGASITVEGFIFYDNGTSVYCNSDKTLTDIGTAGTPQAPVATGVTLLRSLIMSSDTGIVTRPLCQLTLDQSWIGAPPLGIQPTNGTGNYVAMTLDSTQFEIVNSVFNHNTNMGVFGGIKLTDSQAMGNLKGRIVNSTFYRQENIDATPAMSVYCPAKPAALTIFNTLFVNSSGFTNTVGKPHVDANCHTAPNTLGYFATDENPAPTGTGVITGVNDSIFSSAANSVLTLQASVALAKPLIAGGTTSFNGSLAPTVDADSVVRNTQTVTIGAFEVAH